MPSERSPLLERVPVRPKEQRYPHRTLRRACTALLIATVILVPLLFFLLPHGFDLGRGNRRAPADGVAHDGSKSPISAQKGLPNGELERIMRTTPEPMQLRQWSQYYTSGPHLMGQNKSQAEWTRDRWREFGIPNAELVSYDVYANYPKDHRLALLETSSHGHYKVKYEAKLEEDVLDKDPTTALEDRIPTFHGYSASGNVTGQYVFANYGSFEDFEDLLKAGVELEGKIALVKYGGNFRGLKVKRAQELGMIGCVIYTDPGDDGLRTQDPEEMYPDGPCRNPSSVQRGSVQFLSLGPGDPTTPGYPSKPGAHRQSPHDYIPSIPSIPISYEDALPLLLNLNGHGPKADSFGEFWHKGGLGYKGVKYNVGPSPKHSVLNLMNEQEYVITPIWNVIGIINGTLEDEVVILGNHRDAWIAGGAGDPNSGSSALNEVARGMGKALKSHWKPLRTIVLASWDGEEYGLVGSTEWVEEYLPWLSKAAVAYLNVDMGARGPDFKAAASPLLDSAMKSVVDSVLSPNQTIQNQTVGDVWRARNGRFRSLGSGSDYTAFQDYAGISSIDFGFAENPSLEALEDFPVYQYHSNYDSFHWMDRFGDPEWLYHTSTARIWGLLATKLVQSPVLPFNATNYAFAMHSFVEQTRDAVAKSKISDDVSLRKLDTAVARFREAAAYLDGRAAGLSQTFDNSADADRFALKDELLAVNRRYKYLDRHLLYQKGLDNRSWFKHIIFAPGRWTGYAGAVFPGLVESLEDADVKNFDRWQNIIASKIVSTVEYINDFDKSVSAMA